MPVFTPETWGWPVTWGLAVTEATSGLSVSSYETNTKQQAPFAQGNLGTSFLTEPKQQALPTQDSDYARDDGHLSSSSQQCLEQQQEDTSATSSDKCVVKQDTTTVHNQADMYMPTNIPADPIAMQQAQEDAIKKGKKRPAHSLHNDTLPTKKRFQKSTEN